MSAFRLAACSLWLMRPSMKSSPSPRAHSEALVHVRIPSCDMLSLFHASKHKELAKPSRALRGIGACPHSVLRHALRVSCVQA